MKKSIALILAILLMAILSSCSSNVSNANTSSVKDISDISSVDSSVSDVTTSEETLEEIDISIFPEVKPSSENISIYRDEVVNRLASLEENDSFITEDEWNVISSNESLITGRKYKYTTYFTIFDELFQSVSKYYYPVIFRYDTQLIIWLTSETGCLYFKPVYGSRNLPESNFGGIIHDDIPNEISISRNFDYAVTYSKLTGKVNKWNFGKIVETYFVPAGSVYCGISFFEGIIFRNNTDVFALKGEECIAIAHNVKYVIDADYCYGSDPWCQPLFLMEDGSIKCYIGWKGNQDVLDDSSHLVDLKYEGSYDK